MVKIFKKQAFSIAELIMTMMIIGMVMAASLPVMTRLKSVPIETHTKGGYYICLSNSDESRTKYKIYAEEKRMTQNTVTDCKFYFDRRVPKHYIIAAGARINGKAEQVKILSTNSLDSDLSIKLGNSDESSIEKLSTTLTDSNGNIVLKAYGSQPDEGNIYNIDSCNIYSGSCSECEVIGNYDRNKDEVTETQGVRLTTESNTNYIATLSKLTPDGAVEGGYSSEGCSFTFKYKDSNYRNEQLDDSKSLTINKIIDELSSRRRIFNQDGTYNDIFKDIKGMYNNIKDKKDGMVIILW